MLLQRPVALRDPIHAYIDGAFFCEACVARIPHETGLPGHVNSERHQRQIRQIEDPPVGASGNHYCRDCRTIVPMDKVGAHVATRYHVKKAELLQVAWDPEHPKLALKSLKPSCLKPDRERHPKTSSMRGIGFTDEGFNDVFT